MRSPSRSFMDIVGFTSMSKEVAPSAVMSYLNDLFTLMDDLVDEHQVRVGVWGGVCMDTHISIVRCEVGHGRVQ